MGIGGWKVKDVGWWMGIQQKGGPRAAFRWVVREAKPYFSMSIFFTDVNEPACSR